MTERNAKRGKRYADRKAQMDHDPEYRTKVLKSQSDSRRRATERRWQEHVERWTAQRVAVCEFRYPNARRCWKVYPHTHGDDDYPIPHDGLV